MTIKIQTEKPVIPVELGEVILEFPIDDESIKTFRKTLPKLEDELNALNSLDGKDDIESAKEALKTGYDSLFGKGSFERVYQQTPSVPLCIQYFTEIAEGIKKELEVRGFAVTQSQKVEKYLKTKKKK